jgi:hypothetical protein
VFPCRGEDESVIEQSSPVGRSIALETRENPRQNSRNQPGLSIRRDGAMRRPAFDDRNDLPDCPNGGEGCDQFGFRDRGMPRVCGSNRKLADFRETALEDVDERSTKGRLDTLLRVSGPRRFSGFRRRRTL